MIALLRNLLKKAASLVAVFLISNKHRVLIEQRAQLLLLRKRMDPLHSDCVVDVGAKVGHHHDFLRQSVPFKGRIIPVEPVPSFVAVLKQAGPNDHESGIQRGSGGRVGVGNL